MPNISKEVLHELYIVRGKPMHEVADDLHIAVGTVYNYMKKYGIQPRSAKESFDMLKQNGWEYP